MKRQSYAVNFLRGRDDKFIDKFINWSLSAGRFIVILTETIALTAFLYRFGLDRQIIDLGDSIKQQRVIVSLLENNEKNFRNLQDRLKLANSHDQKAISVLTDFQSIVDLARGKVTFMNLSLSDASIKMSVNAQSPGRLDSFVKGLRTLPTLKSVSIDRIENRTSNAIIAAEITADLKSNGGEETAEISAETTLTP